MKTIQERIDAIQQEIAGICSTNNYAVPESWEDVIAMFDQALAERENVRQIDAQRILIRLNAITSLQQQLLVP